MQETARRVLGYRRVSTAEQGAAGTSLDGQLDELQRYAAISRLPVPIDFIEVHRTDLARGHRRRPPRDGHPRRGLPARGAPRTRAR